MMDVTEYDARPRRLKKSFQTVRAVAVNSGGTDISNVNIGQWTTRYRR